MTSELSILGGSAVRTRPWLTYDNGDVLIDEQDVAAAERAVRSQLLFRYDSRPHAETEVGQFEAAVAEFFGSQFVLATSSGTTALALALMGVGIGEGDVVACPAFTFPATPSAIKLTGAEMQLVEVDENLNFDIADLATKLSPRLRAIVVVHMRGVASNIEEIIEFADEHDIIVIEDAVPVFGSTYNGKMLGTFGKVGAFSTQSDKALNTGEGGLVITDDQITFERMCALAGTYEGRLQRHLTNQGLTAQIDERTLPILSWRMDEIRAAVGRSQLAKFPARRKAALRNLRLITRHLTAIPGLTVRQSPARGDGLAGDSLILMIDESLSLPAQFVATALRAEGISARCLGDPEDGNARCFWNWLFAFPGMHEREIRGLAPISATHLQSAVDIPLSPLMSRSDRDDLFAAITKVMSYSLEECIAS